MKKSGLQENNFTAHGYADLAGDGGAVGQHLRPRFGSPRM